jgi:DNA-binding NarL/FixJ family response regulator
VDEVRVTTRHPSGLTPREQQILERLRSGETTREIAASYGIARQTVKNYATVIYEKLGVTGRAELPRAVCASVRPGSLLGDSGQR